MATPAVPGVARPGLMRPGDPVTVTAAVAASSTAAVSATYTSVSAVKSG